MVADSPEFRVTRARTRLLLDNPWFGTLALRLKIQEAPGLGTLANNGTILYYDPAYVAKLKDQELLAVMAHEVMHCALGHMWRCKSRNFRQWNEACDIAINQILRRNKFELPPTYLQAEEATYENMSAEQIYELRKQNSKSAGAGITIMLPSSGQDNQGDGDGAGQGDKDGDENQPTCGLQPAPDLNSHDPHTMTETDWQVIAEQATIIAKKAGKMPAELDRTITGNRESKVDWRTILRRFIEQIIVNDYSWTSPNRRFISQGLYLPGMIKGDSTPRIGIAVDTSGSIDNEILRQFANEITSILHEVRPERIDVVYCDAVVHGQESFDPDDAEVVLHAKGGGGTAFQPALDVFNNHKDGPPACVIYLTDLYGPHPKKPEDYPVLWAVTEASGITEAPFGEFVKLSVYN